jgi:hypothetical protein
LPFMLRCTEHKVTHRLNHDSHAYLVEENSSSGLVVLRKTGTGKNFKRAKDHDFDSA